MNSLNQWQAGKASQLITILKAYEIQNEAFVTNGIYKNIIYKVQIKNLLLI